MTKITTDFVGTENIAVTKQRLTDILAYWGASTAAYTTWGQARTALNALLTSTTAGTIGSTELAGSFLPKINFLNDPDDMIADALFGAGEQGVWLDPSDVANVAWRRNLFLYSEQFNNAYWTKIANGTGVGPTVTANAGTAPDGTVTADRIQASISSGSTSAADFALVRVGVAVLGETVGSVATRHRYSVYLKSNTGSDQRVTLGYDSPAAAIVTVTSTWTRFDIFPIVSGGSAVCDIGVRGLAGAGAPNQPIDILAWGAQLEQSTTATDYQRITDLNTEIIERFPNATMYQDAAGTVPVYAPGQPIGLRLDKSKGLVLGPELVTNGDFPVNTTGWTASNSTLSVDTGRLKILPSATYGWAYQAFTTVVGRTYRLSYSLTNGDAVGCYMYVDPAAGSAGANYNSGLPKADGTYTAVFVATATTTYVKPLIEGPGKFAFYDNISVKELPGNHAVQATLGSRPMYGIEPKGGTRNLLTWTEQFDNAAWNAGGNRMLQVTANAATAPDGTTTAEKVFEAVSGAGSVAHNVITLGAIPAGVNTLSVYAKKAERKRVFLFVNGLNQGAWYDLDTGAFAADGSGATAAIQNVGNGWYRCSLTTTPATAGTFYLQMAVIRDSATTLDARVGDGTSGVFLWGAQFETGTTATNYQRVTTAFDVTEAGVNTCHYCQYDGSDDGMVTNSIDFTATDKMSVFAGVRKTSDGGAGVVAELGDTYALSGRFGLFAPSAATPDYGFGLGGGPHPFASATTFAAPIANVVTAKADYALTTTAEGQIRVNAGSYVNLNATTGTSGNFGNHPLYLGRRGGSSLPFNGRDYGIIITGKLANATAIATTEMWLANKTAGVNL